MAGSSRGACFGVILVGATAFAIPAVAQSSGGTLTTYPTCGNAPVSKSESDFAHDLYKAGKRAFDEADYASATNYFRDAYRRDCSKHELLNLIARAYELKGDRAEAINALETYVARAPAGDPSLDAIQRRITTLKQQLAQEKQAATATPAPVPVEPPAAPAPAPPPPIASAGGHTAGPWVLIGVGGAAMVAGGVMGVVALGKLDEAETLCPDQAQGDVRTCGGGPAGDANAARAKELQLQFNTLGPVAITVGGVGLAAVVGGVIWHLSEKPAGSSTSSARAMRPRLLPELGPQRAGLSLGARF